MSAAITDRPVRGINMIVLSDGREIHLDLVATAAEGQAILDDVDQGIDAIERQLTSGTGPNDPDWRRRAELALKRKRRSRPRIQQRIGELRRAERQAAPLPSGTTSPADGKRKAFVKAAYEVLGHEVCTEVWARAQEMRPEIFTDGQVPA